jgi:hypothetical protein
MFKEFRCGHRTNNNEYFHMTLDKKRDFIKWKYSVGCAGNGKMCYECYLKKNRSEDETT